jgi:diguanylate cyclase (GGDEF)-like protein
MDHGRRRDRAGRAGQRKAGIVLGGPSRFPYNGLVMDQESAGHEPGIPFDEMSVELNNQDLKEILEIASQITAQLDIESIVKYVIWSFYAKVQIETVTFVLAEDLEVEDVRVIHYRELQTTDLKLSLPSVLQLIQYLDKQEYSQISFSYLAESYPDRPIIQSLQEIQTDFIVPIRTDKGVAGFVLLPRKADLADYTLQEIQYFIRIIRFAAIAIENANLYWQATTDRMTRLFSHHFFEKSLDDEINRSRRYSSTFALIMFDIDHFKNFNDTYGHLQGDMIIKEIATILLGSVRNIDFCSRYGGEEFAVILPEVDREGAAVVAERLRRKIEEHAFPGDGETLHVTISVGVAEFDPARVRSPSQLVAEADRALYESKERGRNCVTVLR